MEKQVPTCFSHIRNAVADVKGCRFSSSFERLWLILVFLNNLCFLLVSESEVSKSGLRYFLCLSRNVAQGTRLFCSVWPFESLCAEIKTVCPYTPYCALLSRSDSSNLVKNCGAYTALASKYLCREKSRCPLLPVFIIIRSMLCSRNF